MDATNYDRHMVICRKHAKRVRYDKDEHDVCPECAKRLDISVTVSSPISASSIRLSEQEYQAEQLRMMIDDELSGDESDVLKVEKLEFALDLIENQKIGSRIARS